MPAVLAVSLLWTLFFAVLLVGLGAWFVFLWAVRTGQFRDPEETAERMLELDEADDGRDPARNHEKSGARSR